MRARLLRSRPCGIRGRFCEGGNSPRRFKNNQVRYRARGRCAAEGTVLKGAVSR